NTCSATKSLLSPTLLTSKSGARWRGLCASEAKEIHVPAVRIENRAQLIYLLTEAAEIEHNVLCCYLFAQFSMKDDASEGLTASQMETVRSWRATIGEIAVQEMLHLATACNLLTAVGGAPQ